MEKHDVLHVVITQPCAFHDDGVAGGRKEAFRRRRRGLNGKVCSVDLLAWSTLLFAVEVSPWVEDMDDRCCRGTVMIGAVVPRHTAGVRLDDSSDAGWTTYRSSCSAQYQNVGRDVGRRSDSTL